MKPDWNYIAVLAFLAILVVSIFGSVAISDYSQALIELAKAGCN